jgi:ketosteroid isomerase-like protein
MRYLALVLFAFTCLAQSPADSIRKVLADQVAAWNRGDIDTFMLGYDNSPKTAFIGKTVQHGWEEVRRNYHERYPTPEAMGKFHLARTAQGGGDASGVFTLLFHRTPAGWRIIQDHTS